MKKPVTSDKWQVTRTNSSPATHHSSLAFTLIEVMVVVTLLALIIFALMTVFNSTQNAFRASVTQTDVLEGGRAAMDLIANDLKPMSPADLNQTNFVQNFYARRLPNGFTQSLPASSALRTNVMEDIFFITHENQNWKGVGYFVRTNSFHPGVPGLGNVGWLYRFETNDSSAQFANNPDGLFAGYVLAFAGSNNVSPIIGGVMGFKVRAFVTRRLLADKRQWKYFRHEFSRRQ